MKFFLTLLLLLLLAAAAAGYVMHAPYGPSAETFVDVAPGTSSRQSPPRWREAASSAAATASISSASRKGGTLKAGEYRFDHPAPISEVYARLVQGDVYTQALTIPEGFNIFDIAAPLKPQASPGGRSSSPPNASTPNSSPTFFRPQPTPTHSKAISSPIPTASPATPRRSRS